MPVKLTRDCGRLGCPGGLLYNTPHLFPDVNDFGSASAPNARPTAGLGSWDANGAALSKEDCER